MGMTDTSELLRRYVEAGSEQAFAELVQRHVDLVYSTALRKVRGDAHLAQDITQSVFADFARKARTLSADVVLGGWLYRHTCFKTGQTLREEISRRGREQKAVEMNTLNDDSDATWKALAPLLDDAMARLGARDRDAIVLRYFEGRDLRTVGAALGVNDDAAQKRVSRAVERLREFFTKRGITVAASGLVVVIGANAVQAAPAGLAATLTTASLASATVGTGTMLTLLKSMAMTKLKLTVAAAFLAVGLVPVTVWQVNEYRLRNVGAATPQVRLAEPKPQPPATPQCEVDLRKTGQMKDIISNVLLRAEPKPRSEVQAFLKDVQSRYATGDDLLKAAAEHFKIDQKRLAALVEHWRHINCKHAAIPGYAVPDAGREATTG
jgi:RNA polymerase sigma factor (sigma-70 family)